MTCGTQIRYQHFEVFPTSLQYCIFQTRKLPGISASPNLWGTGPLPKEDRGSRVRPLICPLAQVRSPGKWVAGLHRIVHVQVVRVPASFPALSADLVDDHSFVIVFQRRPRGQRSCDQT